MLLAAFLQAGSECRQRCPLRGPLFFFFFPFSCSKQLAEASCCCGPGVNSPLAVPASRNSLGGKVLLHKTAGNRRI